MPTLPPHTRRTPTDDERAQVERHVRASSGVSRVRGARREAIALVAIGLGVTLSEVIASEAHRLAAILFAGFLLMLLAIALYRARGLTALRRAERERIADAIRSVDDYELELRRVTVVHHAVEGWWLLELADGEVLVMSPDLEAPEWQSRVRLTYGADDMLLALETNGEPIAAIARDGGEDEYAPECERVGPFWYARPSHPDGRGSTEA